MGDVGEERLLAVARALDLAGHFVEGAAELGDLAGSRDRHARPVLTVREASRARDELAQRPRDRPRQEARDDERETGGDRTGDEERRKERPQRVAERRARTRDDDDRRIGGAGGGRAERLLHEEPLRVAVGESAEVRACVGAASAWPTSVFSLSTSDAPVVREHEEPRVGGLAPAPRASR